MTVTQKVIALRIMKTQFISYEDLKTKETHQHLNT